MTLPRWLIALLVVSGLFVMHGITASAASAAAPCGVTAPHDHQAMPTTAAHDGPTLGPADLSGGHEAALCLAVLVGGLALGLLARHRGPVASPVRLPSRGPAVSPMGPAPPLLSLLCVSRT